MASFHCEKDNNQKNYSQIFWDWYVWKLHLQYRHLIKCHQSIWTQHLRWWYKISLTVYFFSYSIQIQKITELYICMFYSFPCKNITTRKIWRTNSRDIKIRSFKICWIYCRDVLLKRIFIQFILSKFSPRTS